MLIFILPIIFVFLHFDVFFFFFLLKIENLYLLKIENYCKIKAKETTILNDKII